MSKRPTAATKEHQYWDTQPVPKIGTKVEDEGPLEEKKVEDIATEPLAIASTFEWWSPDLNDDADLAIIQQLLAENYVEDDSSVFRFNYTANFLRWAMTPPGYYPNWHVAVRKKSDKQVLAFISGIPLHTHFSSESKTICEINFLCVHKKLRSRRMAPILISEVTRRVNLENIWQAVYTAGVVLPKAFATARYFHRSLNPSKLVAIKFSHIPPQYTKLRNPMAALEKTLAVPRETSCKGLRPMVESDCEQVSILLNNYLSKYKVAPVWNLEEVRHWLLPREGVLWAYVIEDSTSGKATDFVSFYNLPSSVIGNAKYPELRAAYTYYYVAQTVSTVALMQDALTLAKANNFDVFNTLNMLDNAEFIDKLKFGPGDGALNYYMYNWRLKEMKPDEVGLVML